MSVKVSMAPVMGIDLGQIAAADKGVVRRPHHRPIEGLLLPHLLDLAVENRLGQAAVFDFGDVPEGHHLRVAHDSVQVRRVFGPERSQGQS